MVASGDVESGSAKIVGCDLLEDAGLLTPEIELWVCWLPERSLAGWFDQRDQFLRVGIGQRLEEYGVDHGKDSGIDADSDGDHQDGDDGESRRFASARRAK